MTRFLMHMYHTDHVCVATISCVDLNVYGETDDGVHAGRGKGCGVASTTPWKTSTSRLAPLRLQQPESPGPAACATLARSYNL